MSPVPRVARVPHTAKVSDDRPYCGNHNQVRRGTRKKKLEIVQLWRCSSCKRVFTPGPSALHNKTYPLRMILSCLDRLQHRLLARADGSATAKEIASPRVAGNNRVVAPGICGSGNMWPR